LSEEPEGNGESIVDAPSVEQWRRVSELREAARKQLGANEQWIADEFETIERELGWMRARFRQPVKKQGTIWFTDAKEVLDSVTAGVASRMEARKILGLRGKALPRMPTRRRR
jgi:hypothetical protein